MATHPGMLLAYDDDMDVVATLDYLVQYDDEGVPIGVVNFAAHEEAGGEMTEVWQVHQKGEDQVERPVRGSKVWPEWIGSRAHEFKVELEGPAGRKRIKALVHKATGHRRDRAALEAAVAGRIAAAGKDPADIRDLVGGPNRSLRLDDAGKTIGRGQGPARLNVPLVEVKRRGPH